MSASVNVWTFLHISNRACTRTHTHRETDTLTMYGCSLSCGHSVPSAAALSCKLLGNEPCWHAAGSQDLDLNQFLFTTG